MKGFQPLVCKKEVIELTQNFCEWLAFSDFRFRLSTNKWTIQSYNSDEKKEVTFTASESFRNKYFKETTLIINSVEENVELNTVQQQLIDNIKSKLSNINSIFKIKKFKDI